MYRGILLDLYGTLVHDDDELVASICALVGGRAGVDAAAVDEEWCARIYRAADIAHGLAFRSLADLNLSSLTETATHFGIALDAEDVCREQMRFWRRPPLYADSSAFLQAVQLPVCLVSDVDRDDLDAVLAHHGITVTAAVTSEDARAYKPRPEPFRLALQALDLDASEVVHIGNSVSSDITGAQALGIATALVNRGGRVENAAFAPTFTVKRLTELLPRLHPS